MLCDILKCGYLDIEMLDKCEYDYDDIKYHFEDIKVEDLNINIILESCILNYITNIQNKIDEKITETESDLKGLEDYEDMYNGNIDYEYVIQIKELRKKLEDLQSLDSTSDIDYYTNCLDTKIYIVDDEVKEIYNKYLKEEVEKENEKIGFCYLDLD